MATVLKNDEGVALNASERKLLVFSLGLALASKKRALNASTTSDEMKLVIQKELSDLNALALRFV